MPNFDRGGETASKAAARPSFKRINFFSLKDGETEVLRMIDDFPEWISVACHEYIPTKGAPADLKDEAKDKWPKSWFAVCRAAKNSDGELVFPEHEGQCFICDEMRDEKGKRYPAKSRVFARAVRREKVMNGQRTGYRDATVTLKDADGNETRQKDVIVLRLYWGFVFAPLRTAYENIGTVVDRDFKITRKGSGMDTDYDIWPEDPVRRKNGDVFTLADPEVREEYTKQVDLDQVVCDLASDEHYAKFFDTTKEIPVTKRRKDDEDESSEDDGETVDASFAPMDSAESQRKIDDVYKELMGQRASTATSASAATD